MEEEKIEKPNPADFHLPSWVAEDDPLLSKGILPWSFIFFILGIMWSHKFLLTAYYESNHLGDIPISQMENSTNILFWSLSIVIYILGAFGGFILLFFTYLLIKDTRIVWLFLSGRIQNYMAYLHQIEFNHLKRMENQPLSDLQEQKDYLVERLQGKDWRLWRKRILAITFCSVGFLILIILSLCQRSFWMNRDDIVVIAPFIFMGFVLLVYFPIRSIIEILWRHDCQKHELKYIESLLTKKS